MCYSCGFSVCKSQLFQAEVIGMFGFVFWGFFFPSAEKFANLNRPGVTPSLSKHSKAECMPFTVVTESRW